MNQDAERMKYTGHERDLGDAASAADDLDYMHARFYNLQIGRFLSFDPVGGVQGVSQSLNWYPYVLGNPLKYTDPDGRQQLTVYDDISVVDTFLPLPTDSLSIFFSVLGLLSGPGSSAPGGFPGGGGESEFDDPKNSPNIIGFGCNALIHPAVSGGVAGGALFGGALDLLATPNRVEVTATLGFGLGAGFSVSPFGLSSGKSEGLGLGFASVLGLPAGLNFLGSTGFSNIVGAFFGDELLAGANVGIGVGAGESAAGGITYTLVPYNRCD